MPKGRPKKEVVDNATPEASTDKKLLEIQALDEIIASKHVDLGTLEERRASLDMHLHSVEQEIERKKKESERDMLTRSEDMIEHLTIARDRLETGQREVDLIMQSLATREADMQEKERQMAEFDEERKRFQEKALYIEQTELLIGDRLLEADSLKNEYEAKLNSLVKLQEEAEKALKDALDLQESNRFRSGILDTRERDIVTKESALVEAKEAFRRKVPTNGKARANGSMK